MKISARKGNLANAGFVLDNKIVVASAESWVVSSSDATAHSERMLVETVCKLKHTNYTPGLTMVSVVEPCLMCMSACSQAGYKEICYIIPAKKYVKKIPWMTDTVIINKILIANRGEIALRVIRAVQELGYTAVAVYETPDNDALHIRAADEAVWLGDGPRTDYLNIDKIIEGSTRTKQIEFRFFK